MSKTLDRSRPFSGVTGDSRASYYQGGCYFDSTGKECSAAEAGKPSENGSFSNQVQSGVREELAKRDATQPTQLIDETNPSTNRQEDIDAARARAKQSKRQKPASVKSNLPPPKKDEGSKPVEDPQRAERRKHLKKLHHKTIADMAEKHGLEVANGPGSKDANIETLLDATE